MATFRMGSGLRKSDPNRESGQTPRVNVAESGNQRENCQFETHREEEADHLRMARPVLTTHPEDQ
jgi:hypothetical protein